MSRYLAALLLVLLMVGCGSPNNIQMNRDLPSKGQSKYKRLSPACIAADSSVSAYLNQDSATLSHNVLSHQAQVLPDGSCAEMIKVDSHIHALSVVTAMKSQMGSDSFVRVAVSAANFAWVPVWIDEPHTAANPVQQKSANAFDNSVTASECLAAAQQWAALLPPTLHPQITVESSAGVSRTMTMPCYLQAVFADDADYEAFLGLQSGLPELFHVNVLRNDHSVATVWVHGYSGVH
jgi:hypothetical protein